MNTIRESDIDQYETMVIHPNGETKWLPVESWGERWISVRWGLSGTYDIMLKDGRIVARSIKARTKHPQNLWTAKDRKELRAFVAEKMGITKEDLEARFERHHATMPGQRKCVTFDMIAKEYKKAIK